MKTNQLMTLLVIVLFTFFANAQTEVTYYYPKLPKVELSDAKIKLSDLFKKYYDAKDKSLPEYEYNYLKEAYVFDDRIEMTYGLIKGFKIKKYWSILYFSDILDENIVVLIRTPNNNDDVLELRNFYFPGSRSKDLADYIFFFQHRLNVQRYNSQLSLFEPIAAQYRLINVKPQVSEEQRKYIVQANLLNDRKQYKEAIEKYLKAIELNQTNYPAAYSNLALLYAQINNFDAAIYNMKKYLLLEPEATDARGAQDKIYEWETMI